MTKAELIEKMAKDADIEDSTQQATGNAFAVSVQSSDVVRCIKK